jgi:hypothetical protein
MDKKYDVHGNEKTDKLVKAGGNFLHTKTPQRQKKQRHPWNIVETKL